MPSVENAVAEVVPTIVQLRDSVDKIRALVNETGAI
jgi:hypothetical protein